MAEHRSRWLWPRGGQRTTRAVSPGGSLVLQPPNRDMRATGRMLVAAAVLALWSGAASPAAASGFVVNAKHTIVPLEGVVAPTLDVLVRGDHVVNTTAIVSTEVYPHVIVQGTEGVPTGDITLRFYTNGTCTMPLAAFATYVLPPSGSLQATAFAMHLTEARDYSFGVTYWGDTTYASVATCKKFNAIKAVSSTSLSIHDSSHGSVTSVVAGTAVHPLVAVSGLFGVPTGLVALGFRSGTCDGTSPSFSAEVPLASASAEATTFAQAPTVPGTYAFVARYTGDQTYWGDGNGSACKAFTVVKPSPSLALSIHDPSHVNVTSVPVDTRVHASVAVAGSFGTPTGNVRVFFYAGADCSASTSAGFTVALSAGSVDVTGFAKVLGSTGTYSFRAEYLGNETYAPKTSCVAVNAVKAAATVGLAIHDDAHGGIAGSRPVGTTFHPSVSVSGPVGTPTGTVTVRAFSGTACNTQLAISSTTALSSGAADLTGFSRTATEPGSYSFKATYSGDATYARGDSACVALAIAPPATPSVPPDATTPPPTPTSSTTAPPPAIPTISLRIHDDMHADVTGATLATGSLVHARAAVGGSSGTATGTMLIGFYDNAQCTLPTTLTASAPVTGGAVDLGWFAHALVTPGGFSFRARYLGDATLGAADSACVTITAVGATITPDPDATAGPDSTSSAAAPAASVDPFATPHPIATVLAPDEPRSVAGLPSSPSPDTSPGSAAESGPAAQSLLILLGVVGLAVAAAAIVLRRRAT